MGVVSEYDTIITPMQIDITTSDAITPKEVLYLFKMIFEDGNIGVWDYNIETVLAEKVETILRRGELNTRSRDFYDVYILAKTQSFDFLVFKEAIKSTAAHRETSHILMILVKESMKLKIVKPLKKDGASILKITDTLKISSTVIS